MLHTKKLIFLLSLMFTAGGLMAQETLTLDSVIGKIKSNNPGLKMYRETIKSKDALVEGASAWMAPMVGVGTFMTPYNNFSRPGGQQDGSLMLVAEQKIPNPAKLKANKAFLAQQSAVTEQAYADNFNDLRALARSTYFEISTEERGLNFLRKNLTTLQNLKKLAEIRYTYNQAGLSQIYSMEAKIYETQNKITSADAKIAIGKIKLNALMNRPKDTDFLIDTVEYGFAKSVIDNVLSLAENRSSVKMIDAQTKSLGLENRLIASEGKPEFSIQFNHMQTYNSNKTNLFSLMAGITIPIAPWAAKSYQAKLKANNFDASAMAYQKENMINNLVGMIKTQETQLTQIQKELKVYDDKILPSMTKSYETLLLSYQENKATILDVLNSWKELNDSQLEYIDLLNKYYQNFAEYGKNVEK
ncbi:cobalt-zinc-cadmium efflux system outer membrane protein [Pedobacter sp. UYP30]|uniref:TolC family protein n=1 Tax=Pedobacter sp. UYP30 TaxID=1756400 RepID=UPI00339687EE